MMSLPHHSYRDLAKLADQLFAQSRDDDERLASALDATDPDVRGELLVSDLLNAFQVFYYFFREEPDELEREIMILQPASALITGIVLREVDLLEIRFRVENGEPVISILDGGSVLVNYRGKDAYRRGVEFVDENL